MVQGVRQCYPYWWVEEQGVRLERIALGSYYFTVSDELVRLLELDK